MEDDNIERAIRAAKLMLQGQAMLTELERYHIEQLPEEHRLAGLVFLRWSQGRKFKGGINDKMIAKLSFMEAFKIAQGIFAPEGDK